MERIKIGGGKFFYPEKCKKWDEDTRWDGRNHISVATGSQWEHERLYRTPGGTWILHSWSQWQGSTPRYEYLEPEDACRWLVDNGAEEDAEFHFPGTLALAEV